MDSPDSTNLGTPEEGLISVFGNYRAEWLHDRLFDFFTEPQYLGQLQSTTPVFLQGGRGTGKTTVLRSMEYQGQYRLRTLTPNTLAAMPYWGVYYRIDTSRVSVFDGPEATREQWIKVFSHYLNLALSERLLAMACWVEQLIGRQLDIPNSQRVTAAFGASSEIRSFASLLRLVEIQLLALERYVNNLRPTTLPELTMAARPIEELAAALHATEVLGGKPIFLLIDEYENLTDYQQQVWNTRLKHCEHPLSYKIGVKPQGRRIRFTLNKGEVLHDPADFVLVDVGESLSTGFSSFARRVSEERLAFVAQSLPGATASLSELLPGLSFDAEAARLGGDYIATEVREKLLPHLPPQHVNSVPLGDLLMLRYWSLAKNIPVHILATELRDHPDQWARRRENYSLALLYSINSGRRGGKRRKYYCGTETISYLAANNIRIYLEIVHRSLQLHLARGRSLQEPVDPDTQTDAASEIGSKNLAELEGLSRVGGTLKKLVLSLGRVFQVMAHDPIGHTPEVTSFRVSAPLDAPEHDRIRETLREGVAQLALRVFPASKPAEAGDIRDDEFQLHPVLAPYFEISYRRKRHVQLTPEQLSMLISRPRRAIAEVLTSQQRNPNAAIPEQMRLFEAFYNGDSFS